MQKIYKYELDNALEQKLLLPIGADILDVDMQDEKIILWAIVDVDAQVYEIRQIHMFYTGHECHMGNYTHLATLQNNGIVKHVFEEHRSL